MSGRVLCFGSLNVDDVYTVQDIVRSGQTISSTSYQENAGGKGANQSVALVRAGASVIHAGRVGADDGGNMMVELLTKEGIDTASIHKDPQCRTGRAIIQVSSSTGDNAIVLYPGANHQIDTQQIDDVFSRNQFTHNDWLVVQNEISCMDYVLQKARDCSMQIVYNPAPMTSDTHKRLQHVHFLIVNETEAEDLCAQLGQRIEADKFQDQAEYLVSKLSTDTELKCLIITLGANGLLCKLRISDNNSQSWVSIRQPAQKIKVVDTTSAGDTFVGYFAALLKAKIGAGASLDQSVVSKVLLDATKASALACTRSGAIPSIPHLNELNLTQ
ncbi:hypothetical protein MP228_009043 [Amoeboaphelidium protococcarum]|nr:hypothetical protein MP228_009043 [Amoeboaphelidium protococcarum]